MSFDIPLVAVPSQRLSVVLNGQNCQLNVFQKSEAMYVDLALDGDSIIRTKIARNRIPLVLGSRYRGFAGDLIFVDMIGDEQPYYTGLNTRWFLVYLTPDELQ